MWSYRYSDTNTSKANQGAEVFMIEFTVGMVMVFGIVAIAVQNRK